MSSWRFVVPLMWKRGLGIIKWIVNDHIPLIYINVRVTYLIPTRRSENEPFDLHMSIILGVISLTLSCRILCLLLLSLRQLRQEKLRRAEIARTLLEFRELAEARDAEIR